MIRRIGFLALLLATNAYAEVVQTKERVYAVKYADNAVERYSVRYTLNVTTSVREQGVPPVPYQGAPNNPRCTWSLASNIDRSVSLVTRLGQPMPVPNLARSLKAEGTDALSGVENTSCKEANARRESEMNAASKAALERFEKLAGTDFETLKNEARATAGVASVTEP